MATDSLLRERDLDFRGPCVLYYLKIIPEGLKITHAISIIESGIRP
jgi:hypothetical protein